MVIKLGLSLDAEGDRIVHKRMLRDNALPDEIISEALRVYDCIRDLQERECPIMYENERGQFIGLNFKNNSNQE
jgi:GTP-sensing pleiotropic transcriptional regulator CodY